MMRIGVIGGGAAGMVAAIAAKRKGAEVVILEAKDRVGQKLLATGNGKCNLGNRDFDISQYYGNDLSVARTCFDSFGVEETIRFFHELGLFIREKNGYLYPYNEQASAVLDVLRNEVKALSIPIHTNFFVREILPQKKGGFRLNGEEESLFFDRVILATGGKAAPKTGSDGNGYELAKRFRHRIIPVVPALTFLKCEGAFFKAISGVRTQVGITLSDAKGNVLAEECGELQLTEQGLSGIPVFQLSRIAAYGLQRGEKLSAEVDFLPEYSEAALRTLAEQRAPLRAGRDLEAFFTGILNKKIMQLLWIKNAGLKATDDAMLLSEKRLEELLISAKHFTVKVLGTGDFQHAQVSAGGVSFEQVSTRLESKLQPGLYFAGELLDIDGRCGGYNLQWAWTSGYLAGTYASERNER